LFEKLTFFRPHDGKNLSEHPCRSEFRDSQPYFHKTLGIKTLRHNGIFLAIKTHYYQDLL